MKVENCLQGKARELLGIIEMFYILIGMLSTREWTVANIYPVVGAILSICAISLYVHFMDIFQIECRY